MFKDIDKSIRDEKQADKGKKSVTFVLSIVDETDDQPESSSGGGASSVAGKVDDSENESDKEASPNDLKNYMLARDRKKRTIRPPSRFDDADVAAYALMMSEVIEEDEPLTFGEAIRSRNGKKWRGASDEEMDSLERNGTWILIDRPKGERTIGCKWIFKIKPRVPGGEGRRFKGRVVAKGYSQIEGMDYNEVFSLVVKNVTIRLLLSMVVHQDFELEQLDVKLNFYMVILKKES